MSNACHNIIIGKFSRLCFGGSLMFTKNSRRTTQRLIVLALKNDYNSTQARVSADFGPEGFFLFFCFSLLALSQTHTHAFALLFFIDCKVSLFLKNNANTKVNPK